MSDIKAMPKAEHECGRCAHGFLVQPFAERIAVGEVIPALFDLCSWNAPNTETLAATARTLLPEFVPELDELATKRNCYQCYGDYVETHHLVLQQALRQFRSRVDDALSKTRSEIERLENIIQRITDVGDSLDRVMEERTLSEPDIPCYVYAIEVGEYWFGSGPARSVGAVADRFSPSAQIVGGDTRHVVLGSRASSSLPRASTSGRVVCAQRRASNILLEHIR